MQTEGYGGWLFGAANGYTNRANSANALSPSKAFADVLRAAERYYSRKQQDAVFRISPLADAEADGLLDQAGYTRGRAALVMIAEIEANEVSTEVQIRSDLTDDWLRHFSHAKGLGRVESDQHRNILSRITGATGFATLTVDDVPIGFGLAVVDLPFAGLFDIVVSPRFRGGGKGNAIVSTLLGWAATRKARKAHQQVHEDNGAAISLYSRNGFAPAYRYHYRLRKTSST